MCFPEFLGKISRLPQMNWLRFWPNLTSNSLVNRNISIWPHIESTATTLIECYNAAAFPLLSGFQGKHWEDHGDSNLVILNYDIIYIYTCVYIWSHIYNPRICISMYMDHVRLSSLRSWSRSIIFDRYFVDWKSPRNQVLVDAVEELLLHAASARRAGAVVTPWSHGVQTFFDFTGQFTMLYIVLYLSRCTLGEYVCCPFSLSFKAFYMFSCLGSKAVWDDNPMFGVRRWESCSCS